MPQYEINVPGAGKYRVSSPTDLTDQQVWEAVQGQLAAQPQAPEDVGILGGTAAAFKRGLESFGDIGSGYSLAMSAALGDTAAAQEKMRATKEEALKPVEKPALSFTDLERIYKEKGLLSALSNVPKYVAEQAAESAPQMATPLAVGAGAAALSGPLAPVVGPLAGIGTYGLQQFGSLMQRQAQEKQTPEELDVGKAATAAAIQAPIGYIADRFTLGLGGLGKKGVVEVSKELAARRAAGEIGAAGVAAGVGKQALKGAAEGFIAEAPTEALEQVLERWQAGLPLDDEKAYQEYKEAFMGAGAIGTLGGGVSRGATSYMATQEPVTPVSTYEEDKAKALAEMGAQPEEPIKLPGGFSIQREEIGREVSPEAYGVFVEGQEEPLTKVETPELAAAKVESFKQIREKEREGLLSQIEKLNEEVQKRRDRIDYLEATGQTATQEYEQAKAILPEQELAAETKARELAEQMEQLGKPLTQMPVGQKETVQERFNVLTPTGDILGSHATQQEAEASVRSVLGEGAFKRSEAEIAAEQEKKVRDERIAQIEKQLLPKLKQFGLQDVGLKIVDQIENNAGGAYLNKLIRVAFDEANPMQTMRHESVHALKDLGFFTPQQWKALEERAKKEWIKEHLEKQTTEIDGQQMSRLEGYRKIGYSEDAIIEEAIADAFGSYDKGATPPPGLIASLFKKLKNFFTNFGQALRGAGFESADDIFQRVERGELKAGKPAEPSGEIKYSVAPAGIPQKLWDLHEKSQEADEKARYYNVGPLKANATKATNRLLRAVAEHIPGDEHAQIAFMVKMNEESSRREREAEAKLSLKRPASDIGHKREATSGRYVGAPDWVGSSPQQLTNLRKKLKALAKEGEPGRYWYENSSKAILELADGDKKEAEKIVSLIAIYSPNATVPANTSMALNAYYQFKTGQPIKAGTTDNNKKAAELLEQNKEWSGIKTNSFYQNLMVEIDPSKLDPGVATMDMWMAIAFDYGMKSLDQGPKYKFTEREIQRLAEELGWKAHQVQAAIWTAMKGRVDPIRDALKEKELKLGIGEMVEKDGKQVYRVKPDRRYDHFRLAHKMGMDYNLLQSDIEESKYDFSDAIRERSAQMSWEATPGATTGILPGIFKAPINQKFEYLEAVAKVLKDKDGYDIIAKAVGMPGGKTIFGFSAWQGDIGAGAQTYTGVAMQGAGDKRDLTPQSRAILNLYAAIKGYVLSQEAVVYHVPDYNGSIKNQNGIELKFNRALNEEEMAELYRGIHEKFKTWEIAPGYTPNGSRLLNFVESSGDMGSQSIDKIGFKGKIDLVIRDKDWNETPVKAFVVKDGVLTTKQKVPANAQLVAKLDNKAFHAGVESVLSSLPETFGGGMIDHVAYRSIGDYISNDWTEAKNGEQYLEKIASAQAALSGPQRPNLQEWAADVRSRVEAVNERFAKKYGWGKAGTAEPSEETVAKLSLKQVAFPSVKEVKEAVAEAEIPDTHEFKLFVGASKWVDKDKKPMFFYHATAREFFEFTPAGQSQAIFLATTPEEAETFGSIAEDRLRREIYKALNKAEKLELLQRVVDAEVKSGNLTAKAGTDFMKQADRKAPEYGDFGDIEQQVYDALLDLSPTRMSIMPLYARAETPFDFENPEHVNQVMQWVMNNTQVPQDFPEKWAAGMKGRISQGLWQAIEDKRVQEAIRALNFDAFTVRENRNSPKNYAVYSPNQVKSITGNIGDYGLESKDIRYSLKSSAGSFNPSEIEKLSETKHKSREKLINMRISDFLNLAEEGFVDEKQKAADQRVKDGVRFTSIPQLMAYGDGDTLVVEGHEGRHRARALQKAGFETMPVLLKTGIRYSEQTDPEKFDYRETWPTKLQADSKAKDPSFSIDFPFTREEAPQDYAQPRYSLPKLPTAMDDRISETTTRRDPQGFYERMTQAISPQNWGYFRQKAINRYNQLSVYDKKRAEKMGGAALLADQSAESAALMSDLGAGVAASAMGFGDRHGGIPVYKNGVTTIDRSKKGLIAVLQPLAKYGNPKMYQYYQYWAMVKRGVRLNAQGKETGIDSTDVQYAKYLEEKFPEFVQVQKEFIEFNNGLVKYARDTGVISEQNAQEFMKYADYVPFYRQMDGETTVGPNIFQSIAGVKAPKKLKGGTAPLADFLETAVRNTQSMIQAGMKNAAAKRAVDVVTQVQAPGMGAERLDHEATGPDVFHVLENGKRVSYRTPDHLLLDAISSLHMPEIPGMAIFSAPAQLLRTLVTKDPGFMMANLMRDSLSAWVTSGVNTTPIAGTVINFGKVLARKSPGYEALIDAGVIGGYELSQNIERSGRELEKDLTKKAGQSPKLLKPFTSLWDALEKGTEASDAATRALVYERVLKETGNEAEALFRALEVMNFNRKGNSPLVRVLTAAVPFLNARIQGLDLFFRAASGNMNMADKAAIQRKFWMRGATMMFLSTMYWLMVHDDDEYKKQNQETKDNNWLFPSLGFMIPIPFEVGTLFKTVPERIAASLWGTDTGKDTQEAMWRIANSFVPLSPAAYLPQALKPMIEVMTDFNFFTQRPIVGEGMKDVAPQFQVGPNTTKAAEIFGKAFDISPMKVDHLLKGYTGTLGMYALDVTDSILDQFGDSPKAAKRFEQMPIIKRFAIDPEARGSVTAYYQLKDAVDTTVRTMNQLQKTMKPEDFSEYVRENIGMLAVKDYVGDLYKTMKEFNDMRGVIQNSKMNPEQKRDALLTITKAQNNLTANIQTVKKAIDSIQ